MYAHTLVLCCLNFGNFQVVFWWRCCMSMEKEYMISLYNLKFSLPLQKVENRVRILSDLRELASSESPDSFTLVYTNILEQQPDCPVSFLVCSCPCKEISKPRYESKCQLKIESTVWKLVVKIIILLFCDNPYYWALLLSTAARSGWKDCGSARRHTAKRCKRGIHVLSKWHTCSKF